MMPNGGLENHSPVDLPVPAPRWTQVRIPTEQIILTQERQN